MYVKTQRGKLVNLANANQVYLTSYTDGGGRPVVAVNASFGPGPRGIGHATLGRLATGEEAGALVDGLAGGLAAGQPVYDVEREGFPERPAGSGTAGAEEQGASEEEPEAEEVA